MAPLDSYLDSDEETMETFYPRSIEEQEDENGVINGV